MTEPPITRAQLDTLEKAADKVFQNYGINIEFTRHFLDRVNDFRNKQQITIKELGMLFAKEYKRWGRKIGNMPVSAEAVMKDLSSAINIPFVINKDGKEKDLVAKTVMRKDNFRTPDPMFQVESIEEDWEFQRHKMRGPATWTKGDERVELNTWTDYKKTGRGNRLRDPSGTKWKLQIRQNGNEVFYKVVSRAEDMSSRERKQRAVKAALKFMQTQYGIDAYEQLWIEGGLPKREAITKEGTIGEIHGATKGTQVKGKDRTPKKSKPTQGNETPHPMRGKLVGETYESVREQWNNFKINERIAPPDEAILSTALRYLDAMVNSRCDKQTIEGYAFDIARSFNLGKIASPRELARLYREWRGAQMVPESKTNKKK